MNVPAAIQLRLLGPAARSAAVREAAAAIGTGEWIVATGSTGYELVGGPSSHVAPSPAFAGAEAALLVPGLAEFDKLCPGLSAPQRRLVRKLDPALVEYRISLDDPSRAHLNAAYRASRPSVIDLQSDVLRVRLLDDSCASRVARCCADPICALRLATSDGSMAREATEAARAAVALGVDAGTLRVLDDGSPVHPPSRGQPTIVSLNAVGGVHVEQEGAYERRFIMSQVGLTVLFVCTGNTCRSPMAQMIASGLASKRELGVPVRFISAGTSAGAGSNATPEALRAVENLGYSPLRHRSQPLTRQLIDSADVIYAMTESHAAGVIAIDPSAAEKTQLLDPAGHDVPDPIGMGGAVYDGTAQRLQRIIDQRLKELIP